MRSWFILPVLGVLLAPAALAAGAPPSTGGPHESQQAAGDGSPEAQLSPEEKMQRRFPQPIRVGDLVGLRLLDDSDSTIGRIKEVVRTSEGKILLIVPYGGLFGLGQRPVPVPIEVVAMLGRQVAALDMPREEFEKAPAWSGSNAQPLGPNETIRIALTRR
jgi:hypothetical protein